MESAKQLGDRLADGFVAGKALFRAGGCGRYQFGVKVSANFDVRGQCVQLLESGAQQALNCGARGLHCGRGTDI
ncbi:hypothetical protein ASD39_24645 [Sphingomonas sp. Root50]|nr:hypothetical protein ASD17_25390 [Sphingomonas sp. Root1294]KQY69558.1 hypothetical protein ASD39_24645 [Sphingomonas sp. Root50]KRB87486.1 hypothetical protein ASE22_24195 [Sphingomonas sp. Root720]